MGAWGLGIFDNDSALDWVYDLVESTGTTVLREAFDNVINGEEYIDVDFGSAAVAAASIIAGS